jgi:hypothetical protein
MFGSVGRHVVGTVDDQLVAILLTESAGILHFREVDGLLVDPEDGFATLTQKVAAEGQGEPGEGGPVLRLMIGPAAITAAEVDEVAEGPEKFARA